jgi:hypothetical protein
VESHSNPQPLVSHRDQSWGIARQHLLCVYCCQAHLCCCPAQALRCAASTGLPVRSPLGAGRHPPTWQTLYHPVAPPRTFAAQPPPWPACGCTGHPRAAQLRPSCAPAAVG